MKREIGTIKPDILKKEWPGQWAVFSHYEQLCCVPGALYVITTKKESGKLNAGWFSSVTFHGDGGDDVDELETAGLTAEASTEISTPRIKEAFLSFECKFESVTDLSGKPDSPLTSL